MTSGDFPFPRASKLPIEVLISPFVSFAKIEAASGILLVISTIAALVWANSPWAESYHTFWETPISIGFGQLALMETRVEWINDGLMPIFFFLVGLEIKREVLIGELASVRQAAFPLIAALGGAIVPVLLYLLVARGGEAQHGWAVPMATDIAFVIGALAILGSRVPTSLKVFVTALAIADDLLAVLVIALFYTDQIHMRSLMLGLAGIGLCIVANLLGVRKPVVYLVIGVFVWYSVLKSGVHATLAGVLLALTIPTRTFIDRYSFLRSSRWLMDRFEAAPEDSSEARSAIHMMDTHLELVESPLHRIEHSIHPWVSYAILPVFAFANLGVPVVDKLAEAMRHPVSLGVALGLFVGKPIGVWSFAWLSAKLGVASAPGDLSPGALFGAAWLCGIGFTMSLFIATLAFNDETLLNMAKIGVLVASLFSGVCASVYLVLRQAGERVPKTSVNVG
jgi:Na+:H+ antiporter, NhaA family